MLCNREFLIGLIMIVSGIVTGIIIKDDYDHHPIMTSLAALGALVMIMCGVIFWSAAFY